MALSPETLKKFPFALLTDDYGILTESDLASNQANAIPSAFGEHNLAYPYWKCFPKEKVLLQCRVMEGENTNQPFGDANILVVQDGHSDEYGFRRAWPLEFCNSHLKKWRKLSKDVSSICLLGTPIGTEPEIQEENGKKKPVQHWIFHRLKTKHGCDSYFEGECTRN